LYGAVLGSDTPAYKLLRHVENQDVITSWVNPRISGQPFKVSFDARAQIDDTLSASGHAGVVDADEEAARAEKAAGLAELYRSRVTVLVGPAGTGKTTLLKALADLPDVAKRGVLLLAPTGKASVQLSTKVGRPARTLASFLINKKGYDWKRDLYRPVDPSKRQDCGLVVIDEASMLTEAMLAATLSALGQVDRLVLVGDPRQLPPIGAGRPFVDLVNHLAPETFGSARVAASYVELTVSRRQGGSDRDDVLLAKWFGGGELGPGVDTVWERLRTGTTTPHLEHVRWRAGDIVKSLDELLARELDWSGHKDREFAFKMTYGGELSPDGKYLNWNTGPGRAAAHAEDWQILSPARSRAFGVVELNRHIKRTLRATDLELSHRWGWRNSRPIGPELIVRGDKVMQTRNDSNATSYPAGAGLDYVANGEIGVVVGSWSKNPKAPAHVEFSSQIGAKYTYWPTSSEDPPLELAWAVTVHKSQGSEFRKTILVLPRKVNVSRELLYTALTRQTDRVVLLHDGTVDDLVALAHPSRSETARRLTDLFRPAVPRVVEVDGVRQSYDGNLVHVADNGVLVRSKNEVIVADILEKIAPGSWRYEVLLEGDDGSWCRPDFTITTPSGVPVYWEHLGMMSQPSYVERWKQKLAWYASNGITPGVDEAGSLIADPAKRGGPNGVLVWTDDARGVDKPAWTAMATAILGHGAGVPLRKAKKTAARPST
jgi:energy-coupling factor transporter ATP-binding protein EcfA2